MRINNLDFLTIDAVLAQTASIKEETKRAVDAAWRSKEKAL